MFRHPWLALVVAISTVLSTVAIGRPTSAPHQDPALDTAAWNAAAASFEDDQRILPEIAAAVPGIPCYPSSATSPVVKVFYLYSRGTTNRLTARRTAIREAIGYADLTYALSAKRTGGTRHVRWAMATGCKLSITAVAISPSLSFGWIRRYLRTKGLLKSTQKAVAFREARPCMGLGDNERDDRPGGSNRNNRGGTLALVMIQPCLDEAADPMDRAYAHASLGFGAAHELAHTLGAVQRSAPHSTAGGHCTDAHDVMCYQDAPNVRIRSVCAITFPALFDCGQDDYFDTNPKAGSYLATHWNIARSRFLATRDPSQWDPLPRPTIALIATADGATLDEGLPVQFDTGLPSDGAAIAGVALLVDGSVVSVDRVAPFDPTFHADGAPPGELVTLKGVAFDALGRQASSATIKVAVGNGDAGGDALTIVSPQENGVVTGPFLLVVGVPPDSIVTSASVYVNGTLIGTVTAGTWSLQIDPAAIGAQYGDDLDISVWADDSGDQASVTVTYLPP